MRILITGGAGFLGRGILLYLQRYLDEDLEFTIYSRDELKQDICKRKFPKARYVLGDIQDTDRLSLAMIGHDTVIHAAALKYVPDAERNVNECVSVNIDGTRSVIKAAFTARVHRVIGISTDKAVMPVNVYGMTKAVCERLYAEYAKYGGPYFSVVRYGNVVGSTGSVIPVFQRQLAERGSIQVTDPKMTRFWLSVTDAIDLIRIGMQAKNNHLPSGSVIIPKSRSMTMRALAESMTTPNNITIIGPRPGEKRHELLLSEYESMWSLGMDTHYELWPLQDRKHIEHSVPPFSISSSDAPQWNSDEMLCMIKEAAYV